MHRILLTWPAVAVARRFRSLAVVAVTLAAVTTGCKNDTEAIPETGADYYPVAVGRFWTYAVTDTVWGQSAYNGQVTRGGVVVTNTQKRETITETFTDAAGNTAYRMVRAKRDNAAAAWRDDSVFVVTATPQFVSISRSNVRTLEAVFAMKEGGKWHVNAFNNSLPGVEDTVKTRQYSRLGQPYTTAAIGAQPAVTYPLSVTTTDMGPAAVSNLLNEVSYQQIFAKNIGPVFRNRRNLAYFNYTASNGNQVFPAQAYNIGSYAHRETLIDYGPK
ncbi:hypothetical protein [Hymenobacter negativus]|uniref:Lipoprotein n=1 Tax=Hymenobacter negativus TaxID=2795026 RepID=A0ABS3QMV4_9BACT|nr:hypothetical protein [Hymenobacter negativus]MBO2012601.1 hypothetical protein [Hymenobacter negativus]